MKHAFHKSWNLVPWCEVDGSSTWRRQICVLIFWISARLWLLWRMDGWGWGLNPYLFLWLVIGVIIPMIWSAMLGIHFAFDGEADKVGFSVSMCHIDVIRN